VFPLLCGERGVSGGGWRISRGRTQLLGKGTPRALQGLSAEGWLTLLQLWIAILVRTEQESPSGPMLLPSMPCASNFSFPSRQNEQTTFTTGCYEYAIELASLMQRDSAILSEGLILVGRLAPQA
jgi:hypothetical protein